MAIGKGLSERIAARVKARKPTRGGLNRAAFLAVRDDVTAAHEDGWSTKDIWDTLHAEGKISFGYEAFLGYTKRLVLAKSERGSRTATQTPPATSAGKKAKPDVLTGGVGGFKYEAKPNKKDIL